jgi:hypothetical protein
MIRSSAPLVLRLILVPTLGLVLLLGSVSVVWAENAVLRNESPGAIVVQTVTVIRGVSKRDQYPLKPGDFTPKIATDTEKLVIVLDGKTGKVMFRDVLKPNPKLQGFSILYDPKANAMRMKPQPRLPEP